MQEQQAQGLPPKFSPIGLLLVNRRLITQADVDQTLAAQKSTPGERFGTLLVRRGALSEEALLPVLAEQLGLPLVNAENIATHKETFLLQLEQCGLTIQWCRQALTIIWSEEPDTISIAARDPLRSLLQEIIRAHFPRAKLKWHLARGRDIERLLDEAESNRAVVHTGDLRHLKELAEEAPIIELVNGFFARATDARASDIHIEPEEFGFSIRLRIDGVMQTLEEYPREKFDATVSRIKLISDLDIAERRLPQDGRFSMRAGGRESDVRVSVIPGVWGESVVMRLLPKERGNDFSLDNLGMEPDNKAMFEGWIREPHGIVLVTGPTGSGKSTTLYTALTLANDRTNKIITVEDPVEFKLSGVTQIQVQSEIGYTFASALRAILRHDPDVVMIGEIRDLETAQIAVQASLTGHMVFSTLHTNDALSAFNRLVDMGIEAFLVASSLRGIIAQRLVRRLCAHCSEPQMKEELTPLQLKGVDLPAMENAAPPDWRKPKGCEQCNHTGFRGRIGIYEFLPVDESMQAAIIANRASIDALSPSSRKGYRSMRKDGFLKAYRGITSIEEVIRVTGAIAEG